MDTGWTLFISRLRGVFVLLWPLLSLGAAEDKPVSSGPTKASSFFKDETKAFGLAGVRGERFFAVDVNNDTHTDIVVLPHNHAPPVFYLFDPKKKSFSPLKQNPFPRVVRASFLVFHDLDKDGIRDVIVARFHERGEVSKRPLRIFKGKIKEGALSYHPVPFSSRPLPTSSLVLFDYNLDGHIDFFQGNYFEHNKGQRRPSPDILWHGQGMSFQNMSALLEGEHIVDQGKETHPNARPTIGASLCDVDQNGYPDILTASTGGRENKMWLNLPDPNNKGDRLFKDYAEASGYAEDSEGAFLRFGGGHSFFSLCADYNNDGLVDVAVGELTEGYAATSRDPSSILTGSKKGFPPKFLRTAYSHDKDLKHWPQGDRRGLFVDLDFDGLPDLLVDNSGFPPESPIDLFQATS